MNSDHEIKAIERASRRWHSESVGTQLLRALAEAEERDAAVAKRAYRCEIKAISILSGVTHDVVVNPPTHLELLCLELHREGLEALTCVRLTVGTLVVVEGAPLDLLNRAWLTRVLIPAGVGVRLSVHNRTERSVVLEGALVGLVPETLPAL